MNKWVIIVIVVAIVIVAIILVIVLKKKSTSTEAFSTYGSTYGCPMMPGVPVVPSTISGVAGSATGATAAGLATTGSTPISSLPSISPVVAKTPTEIVVPTTMESNSNYLQNDLYPPENTEDVPVYRPSNSMYTHLETNFLDVGPQIGVGTRVNSHKNGAQLIFRKQYQVPTVPTGYWNQSVISQPIFTNNVC